jgi:hypothetical protein
MVNARRRMVGDPRQIHPRIGLKQEIEILFEQCHMRIGQGLTCALS